ncbi:MAG: carboxymuconolactone decarboxylase family protein [Burkholderiaceae bacterium]
MRLPKLGYDDLDDRQKQSFERHAVRRKVVTGPYYVWLHSPDLMDKVSALATYLRLDCKLPEKLREFGILVTARFWDAQYSWNSHVDKAIAAGISHDVVKALAEGRRPDFQEADERIYYDFATELLQNHFVSDETFAAARTMFGDEALVDLIGSVGYWSMLAMCLNSAEVDLQAGRAPPFPDMHGYRKIKEAKS